jgi:hypothetical protein
MLPEKWKQATKQWLPVALAIASTIYMLPAETRWMPIASATIWALVRVFKDDSKIPGVVPQKWRPVVALGLSAAASGVDLVISGGNWRSAVSHAAAVCMGAIAVHVFGVDVLGAGKDMPLPKALSKFPPAPPGGASMPPIPPSAGIPVITDDDIPTRKTLDLMGMRAARRGIAMTLVAASLTFAISGCHLFTPRVVELLFDLGCVITNAELPDAIRDRVCAVPPEHRPEAHKAAAAARVESRRFAAAQVAACRADGGAP